MNFLYETFPLFTSSRLSGGDKWPGEVRIGDLINRMPPQEHGEEGKFKNKLPEGITPKQSHIFQQDELYTGHKNGHKRNPIDGKKGKRRTWKSLLKGVLDYGFHSA